MKWKEAMKEEYNAHLANGTWTIVKLPPGQMVVPSKWVYKLNTKLMGQWNNLKHALLQRVLPSDLK